MISIIVVFFDAHMCKEYPSDIILLPDAAGMLFGGLDSDQVATNSYIGKGPFASRSCSRNDSGEWKIALYDPYHATFSSFRHTPPPPSLFFSLLQTWCRTRVHVYNNRKPTAGTN